MGCGDDGNDNVEGDCAIARMKEHSLGTSEVEGADWVWAMLVKATGVNTTLIWTAGQSDP